MKIIKIKNISDIKHRNSYIKKEVKKNGSVILRGACKKKKTIETLKKIYKELKSIKKIGTTSASKRTIRKLSCKWSIGGHSGAQLGLSRFMLTLYNPLFSEDKFKFRSEFQKLIQLRDIIRDDGKSTIDKNLTGSFFNACRFQIYPSGGGFMLGHTDYAGVKNSKKVKNEYFQMLIFLTERGKDFKEGGAYLIHKKKRIDIEKFIQRGDIVVYDGKSFHGVSDIDPKTPFSEKNIKGRVVALSTIYN